ncbi:fumarate reductase/succinate dehydrogenase flavoprotein subunit, partial [Acinetobacter baumannii]
GNYLSSEIFTKPIPTDHPEFVAAEKAAEERMKKLLSINGTQSVEDLHRKLGKIMWEYCGMARNEEGLKKARKLIQDLRN